MARIEREALRFMQRHQIGTYYDRDKAVWRARHMPTSDLSDMTDAEGATLLEAVGKLSTKIDVSE
jgi:hypothetical protein